jgi:hypothetical protein
MKDSNTLISNPTDQCAAHPSSRSREKALRRSAKAARRLHGPSETQRMKQTDTIADPYSHFIGLNSIGTELPMGQE